MKSSLPARYREQIRDQGDSTNWELEVTRTETRGTGRDLEKKVVENMDERERTRVTQDDSNSRLGGLGLGGLDEQGTGPILD